MTGKGPFVAGGLVGALLTVVAAGRVWYRTDGHAFTGNDLTDHGVRALALTAAAGFALMLLTGPIAQRVVGCIVTLVGAGSAILALVRHTPTAEQLRRTLGLVTADGRATGAHWLAVAGSLLVVAAGVGVVMRAGKWAHSPARFERTRQPGRGGAQTNLDAWRAMDAGLDPTRGHPETPHEATRGNLIGSPDDPATGQSRAAEQGATPLQEQP